jgi:hypothetical protein
MPVPNTFGTATTSIPLSQLDANFNTPVTIGSTSVGLGNTVTTIANLTLTNATISSGNVTVTTGVFGAGSNTAPSITTTGDTNTGIFFPAADTIAFTEGGSEAMRIDSSGNVSIGTTSSYSKLNVLGDAVIASSAGTANQIYFYSNGATSTTGSFSVGQGFASSTDSVGFLYNRANAAIVIATNATERMRITSTGILGVGTTGPAGDFRMSLAGDDTIHPGLVALNNQTATQVSATLYATSSFGLTGTRSNHPFIILTNGTERMRIDSSGNVGIGTSSPSYKLQVNGGSGNNNNDANTIVATGTNHVRLKVNTPTSGGYRASLVLSSDEAITGTANEVTIQTTGGKEMLFTTNGTERMRITSGGNLLVATTSSDVADANGTGASFSAAGNAQFSRASGGVMNVNRKTDDGVLVYFQQDGVSEGNISVSGSTVSYNAFAGSHWSQLSDGSKPAILRGTVLESINELVEWEGEPTTERLCRVKVSDTAGSKKVYGVFMCWDEEWTATNDMLVTSVGAFICRINKDVVVQEGDLLESNGDGTARVQADDVMRSSTIGKVTCTVKTHEYDDGSYCVPTVLYCG